MADDRNQQSARRRHTEAQVYGGMQMYLRTVGGVQPRRIQLWMMAQRDGQQPQRQYEGCDRLVRRRQIAQPVAQ
jgi:hypothetical protein